MSYQPITNPLPVSGTFWQTTQPVSIAASVPVTGTFWQATQPVSIAATVAISAASLPLPTGAALDATLTGGTQQSKITDGSNVVAVKAASTAAVAADKALVVAVSPNNSVAVTGTFWQSTQPVSIAATVNVSAAQSGTWNIGTLTSITNAVSTTAPTLTKGTQSANGWSVQNLHDAGRSALCMTAEFSFAQTAETLLTMTLSVDGAATTTFSSRVITSGKKFRIQSVSGTIESLGSGTAPQRAYLSLRRNTAGATTTSSPEQAVWGFVNATAVVKSGFSMDYEVPDALEMTGDGTGTFGFSLETPDWVSSTATGRIKLTVIGFEY